MVAIDAARASNDRIASDLPSGLVCVFAGATRGIGEATMRQFVKKASKPRVYFSGRTQATGDRVLADLRKLNPDGEYTFLKYDLSLLRNVDDMCRELRTRESSINLLFVTMGTIVLETTTAENLHYWAALSYYCRMRLAVNLLPQLQKATSLRRVNMVLCGSKEGSIDTNNLEGHHLGMSQMRGHIASMITLGLEALQKQAPEVSFVHNYPGFVLTDIVNEVGGRFLFLRKFFFKAMDVALGTPIDLSADYHTFLATSARFPAARGEMAAADGVPLKAALGTAIATDSKAGGVYAVNYDGETSKKALDVLASARKDGTAAQVWKHTEDVFTRVTESLSI